MAKCKHCGREAGFMSSTCDDCLPRERQMLAQQAQANVRREALEEAQGNPAAERRLQPDFQDQVNAVQLTTASSLAGFRVVETVDVITAEAVMGMSIFGDLAASLADVFGGRSESTQQILREARRSCLWQLRAEAASLGANAVIALRLDYSAMGSNNSMLFLVASGTAVRVVPEAGAPEPA